MFSLFKALSKFLEAISFVNSKTFASNFFIVTLFIISDVISFSENAHNFSISFFNSKRLFPQLLIISSALFKDNSFDNFLAQLINCFLKLIY